MFTFNRRMSCVLSLLCFTLLACGGGKGGSSDKGPSAYEELSGLSTSLQNKLDETTAPINESDAIIQEFTELPKTLEMKTEDFKTFIISAIQGEMKVPEGTSAKAAGQLMAFGLKFTAFKDNLMATPDRSTELVKQIAVTLTKVPVLVTKVEASAKLTKNNPFASKKEKMEASKQSEGAKSMGDDTTKKVTEIQKTAQELPGKATASISKFLGALKGVGIDNLDSLTAAPGQMAKESTDAVKSDAKEVVDTAKDSAEGTIDAAKDAAK